MGNTLDGLFKRIAGGGTTITRPHVERFLEDAGVGDGWFGGTKVGLATDAFFDKFQAPAGRLSWDAFMAQGRSLLPAGIAAKADPAAVEREIDKLYAALDRSGRGISLETLTDHLTALAEAKGQMMAGTKAEVGAKILMHALDENGDRRLQKDELRSFALDVVRRVSKGDV